MKIKHVILDRDGTLIEYIPYLFKKEKVELIPGTIEAIDISNNQISEIPDKIAQLTTLTSLNLYDVPITMDNVQRVQTLLPSCKITSSKTT